MLGADCWKSETVTAIMQMRADGALDQDGNSEGDEVIFLRETNRISSWMRYGGEGISEREELRMRS